MRVLVTIFLLISLRASAQQAEPIRFQEKSFDFGDVQEKGGSVEHDFTLVNNTGRTIRILSVQASCGCTTPGWTKEPITAGSSAFVKASFDPKGRPGYFNKSLTVTTDFDATAIILQIKGQVVDEKVESSPADYPAEMGNLRFKFNSFPLGKIFINKQPTSKTFPVYNAGGKVINFNSKVTGPAYILVEVPKSLKPHEAGTVRISFDAKAKNSYGFVSENVTIQTDDEKLPAKSFSVYATIEEFFAPLTNEQMTSAPTLQMDLAAVDIGRIRQGNVVNRDIIIKNTGKKELLIRAIQANCTCVTASVEPMKLKPDEEGKLTISLNTTGRTGIQQKAVTLYTTDPKNPVQRLMITGYVEQN